MTAVSNNKTSMQKTNRRSADRRTARYVPQAALRRIIGCDDRRHNDDRRRNPFRRWRRVRLGDLPVVVVDQETTAKLMVEEGMRRSGYWRYPAFLTSTNGEVTHRCAFEPELRKLFLQADAIHADGMPHVFASRLKCKVALPERVATTDLFHVVCAEAERKGATMFMLGASEEVNEAAANVVRERYPALKLVGRRNGFFANVEEEQAACDEIAALEPDILWVSMGVPREQKFIVRHRARLTSVGVIKTSGGLFDFVSGASPGAPMLMQNAGLEWLWRALLEPKRLGWRYLKTNPFAFYLLLTRSS